MSSHHASVTNEKESEIFSRQVQGGGEGDAENANETVSLTAVKVSTDQLSVNDPDPTIRILVKHTSGEPVLVLEHTKRPTNFVAFRREIVDKLSKAGVRSLTSLKLGGEDVPRGDGNFGFWIDNLFRTGHKEFRIVVK